jgi:hypothetical protein
VLNADGGSDVFREFDGAFTLGPMPDRSVTSRSELLRPAINTIALSRLLSASSDPFRSSHLARILAAFFAAAAAAVAYSAMSSAFFAARSTSVFRRPISESIKLTRFSQSARPLFDIAVRRRLCDAIYALDALDALDDIAFACLPERKRITWVRARAPTRRMPR